MNRIQFQPGMSLFALFQQFGTEAQCEAALERARWPHGFRCPRCGDAPHCVLRTKARKTFQCNACHHQTSLIAGTLFVGTKLGLTVWFLAIYLIRQAKTGLVYLFDNYGGGPIRPKDLCAHIKDKIRGSDILTSNLPAEHKKDIIDEAMELGRSPEAKGIPGYVGSG